jgi:hypothetical protein
MVDIMAQLRGAAKRLYGDCSTVREEKEAVTVANVTTSRN